MRHVFLASLARSWRHAPATSAAIIGSAAVVVAAAAAGALVAGLDVVPVTDSSWGARWESFAKPPSFYQKEALPALVLTVLAIAGGCGVVAALSTVVHAVSRLLASWRGLAVRSALGASLTQLLRSILPDMLVLAAAGSVIGLTVGATLIAGHQLALPADLVSRRPLLVLLAAPAAAAGMGLLLCLVLAPLIRSLHRGRRLAADLIGDGVTTAAKHLRVQYALATVQLGALLIVTYGGALVIGASPLSTPREVILDTSDAGIAPLQWQGEQASEPRSRAAAYAALSAATPGVAISSPGAWLGFGKGMETHSICPNCRIGQFLVPMSYARVRAIAVTPGSLESMGVPRMAGRSLQPSDDFDAPRVVVLSHQAAQELFPGANPVGLTIRTGLWDGGDYRVVGVVRAIAPHGLGSRGKPIASAYFSALQHPPVLAEVAIPAGAGPEVRATLRTLVLPGGLQPVIGQAQPLRALMRRFHAPLPWFARIVAVLTIAGTVLSLYAFGAVMMQMVAIRRKDIAIRLALGARPWHVVGWITGKGMVIAAYGVAIGVSGARLLGDALSKALQKAEESDLMVLVVLVMAFVLIGFLTSYVPARLASRLEPSTIFRSRS